MQANYTESCAFCVSLFIFVLVNRLEYSLSMLNRATVATVATVAIVCCCDVHLAILFDFVVVFFFFCSVNSILVFCLSVENRLSLRSDRGGEYESFFRGCTIFMYISIFTVCIYMHVQLLCHGSFPGFPFTFWIFGRIILPTGILYRF